MSYQPRARHSGSAAAGPSRLAREAAFRDVIAPPPQHRPRGPEQTDVEEAFLEGVVDAPLYGSVLRILEWTIAGYDRLGVVRNREGNRLANSAPLDNYPSADGKPGPITRRLQEAYQQAVRELTSSEPAA